MEEDMRSYIRKPDYSTHKSLPLSLWSQVIQSRDKYIYGVYGPTPEAKLTSVGHVAKGPYRSMYPVCLVPGSSFSLEPCLCQRPCHSLGSVLVSRIFCTIKGHVALGLHQNLELCCSSWVTVLLGPCHSERPEPVAMVASRLKLLLLASCVWVCGSSAAGVCVDICCPGYHRGLCELCIEWCIEVGWPCWASLSLAGLGERPSSLQERWPQ